MLTTTVKSSSTTDEEQDGTHDDYRAMYDENYIAPETELGEEDDVFMLDQSLEVQLFGEFVTERNDNPLTSITPVSRSY